MKKIFTSIAAILVVFASSFIVHAQSFSVQRDTTTYIWAGDTSLHTMLNGITNLSSNTADSIVIKWKVYSTDFPADWQARTGICDNITCYNLTGSGAIVSGTEQTSKKYPIGTNDFHMQISLPTYATNGTHTLVVRMYNAAAPLESAQETFLVSKYPTGTTTVVKSVDNILIYPNPASNELNLVYDASADIKTISVYNVIGKLMTVYKVSNNSGANLNLENLQSGMYFVRLMNSHGDVVANRKFNKQ